MLRPVGSGHAGLQGVLEPSVGPLDHAVALRVVRCCGVVMHANDVARVRPQCGLKCYALFNLPHFLLCPFLFTHLCCSKLGKSLSTIIFTLKLLMQFTE